MAKAGFASRFLVGKQTASPTVSESKRPTMSHKAHIFVLFIFLTFAAIVCAQPPTKPQYGSWGFDLAGSDRSTKPGDDFFRFANGTWIDHTQIPPDKPGYSLRLAMSD